MYTRILVPLDGSEIAEQVLPYVRILGRRLKARVELLRIFEPVSPALADPNHGLYLDGIIASVRGHVEEYLERVAFSLRSDGLTVSSTVHEGSAVASIVKEAETSPGTLVALCTHGQSGITRWVLGSTTDKVLHATTQPVFVVRSRERQTMEPGARLTTVLVPLDGSRVAEQALPHAVALAKALELKVVLVKVTPCAHEYALNVAGFADYPYARIQELVKRTDAEARAYVDTIRERLCHEGISGVEGRVLHGHPPDTILHMARELEGGFVAMTTHGGSGIDRWLRGSVADRVVRHSWAPVLVIRAEKELLPDE